MPAPVNAALPPAIELEGGYVIRLAAVNAATGAAVAGVKVSGLVITGHDLSGGTPPGEEGQSVGGPFMLVPGPEG